MAIARLVVDAAKDVHDLERGHGGLVEIRAGRHVDRLPDLQQDLLDVDEQCVRSRTSGPPMLPPNCSWRNGGFSSPARLVNSLIASSASFLANSHAEPFRMLVPDLVTMLSTVPMLRPYSAEAWLVRTWNSWIASTLMPVCAAAVCPTRSSLLGAPSMVKLANRCPGRWS